MDGTNRPTSLLNPCKTLNNFMHVESAYTSDHKLLYLESKLFVIKVLILMTFIRQCVIVVWKQSATSPSFWSETSNSLSVD